MKTIPFDLDRFEKSGKTIKVKTHVGANVLNTNAYHDKGATVVICQVNGEIRQYSATGRHEGKQHLFMEVPVEFYNEYTCVVFCTFNPNQISSSLVPSNLLSLEIETLEKDGYSIIKTFDLKNA